MKPLKLTMSAFGSYADIQTIDFTQLGVSGLYLITGETGSGKTTIFDAVSFALFGKASGSGRDEYHMLRSDFAGEKTKTFAELEFLCGNDKYYIKRAIKKSGQEAELLLPDGTVMGRRREIDNKIIEIIGLDREQFAQIVMIAQNDFLRFLQSGTDERLKILRRIFGTNTLKAFQEQLKALVKVQSDKHALIVHDFERHGVEIYRRGEKFTEWEAQISADTNQLEQAELKIIAFDKRKQELSAALAVAAELDKKFLQLADFRSQLATHASMADEISASEKQTAIGEIALRKIKPAADAKAKAAHDYAAARNSLSAAKEQLTAAKEELAAANKTASELPSLEEAQEVFNALVKQWETASEQLKKLLALDLNRKRIMEKQAELAMLKTQLDNILKELGEIPPIDEKQKALNELTLLLAAETARLDKLTALQNDFALIEKKQKELTAAQADFESIDKEFTEVHSEYRALEEIFLRSQAGIIASSLVSGEPCPVCGSKEHPAPAVSSGNDLTESRLKKEQAKLDKLQNAREAKSFECGKIKTELELRIEHFNQRLSEHIPDASIAMANALLTEAISRSDAKVKGLTDEKAAGEALIKSLEERKISAESTRDTLASNHTALESEVQTLINRLLEDSSAFFSEPDWENVKAALAESLSKYQSEADTLKEKKEADEKALSALKILWEKTNQRKADAEKSYASASALTAERTETEKKLLGLKSEAEAVFESVLKENAFDSEDLYLSALLTESDLAQNKSRLARYENEGAQLTRDIKRLASEISGKEKPDIEKLSNEFAAVSKESETLAEKRDAVKIRLDNTTAILKELRSRAADFEKVEKEYAEIKQLADTANGKLDFETYAQTAYFERVLRAANLRLKIMSQNQYALLRKEESSDGRKRSGLEIEVLDRHTGKVRSASTLSGGESFMTSLSLALGLSDVVRQNAGGVHLDAMFIDEGFGSLDANVLELAVQTLSEMAGERRIIGIISHVSELRERIDKQIHVQKTFAGSKIKMII